MLEILVGIGVCVVMAMIARADAGSPIKWFFITFGICVLAILVPLPYLRFLIAGVLAFILMMVLKSRKGYA